MPEWDNTQGTVRWEMVAGQLVANVDDTQVPLLLGATFTGDVWVDPAADTLKSLGVKRTVAGTSYAHALTVQGDGTARLIGSAAGVTQAALELAAGGIVKASKPGAATTLYAVAERGSNANGEWVKFYNGVMVAWRQTTYVGNVDASTNVPSGWRRTPEQTLTFPVAFVAEPTVTLQHTRKNGVTSDFYPAVYIHNNNASTTQAKYVIISPYGALTGVTLEVGYVAVGRWY